jgi:hypothetical protein
MFKRESPAPPGDNRAGIGYAHQRSDTAPARPAQVAGRDHILRKLRWQRAVAAVHRLGPRALAELLDEIGCYNGIADDIGARVAKYAALDPAILRVVGADRFAALPLHTVARGP